nr:MAG TPA: hypothetical protein [Caudoviricetes sp.]
MYNERSANFNSFRQLVLYCPKGSRVTDLRGR